MILRSTGVALVGNTVGVCDIDGDGIPNYLDLDSDGDGCPDLTESGVSPGTDVHTPSATNNEGGSYGIAAGQLAGSQLNPAATDANNDGLNDSVDPDLNGITNYASTYNPYALGANYSICADTDGDGVLDINDIDDDNDGIPDADESPTCYYTSAEAGILAKVSTGLASSTVNSVAVSTGADIPAMHDGTNTSVAASNHIIAAAQTTTTSSVIYTLEYPTPVKLSSVSVVGATASWGTGSFAVLEGSTDGATFNDALSAPLATSTGTTKTWTVTLNAANYYQYYRIRVSTVGSTTPTFTNYEVSGVLNTSGYIPSAHPKPTCATDTDGDGITNNRDLDSDGDGCSDAKEAGATTSNTANYQFAAAPDANGNGLNDTKETGTTGTINYSSTYNDYALSASANGCTDTDGDGIIDLVDIDDDNDGITDDTEMNNTISIVSKTGITVSAAAITYTYNGVNTLSNLVDGVDNNNYVIYNPTGTLNNAPWLVVSFPSKKILTYFEIGHYQGQTLFSTSSTYKIQGSNDNSIWTDVTGTLTYNNNNTSTSGGLSTYNSNIANISNTSTPYLYYRIYGISGAAGGGWATEFYFKEKISADIDTDGDGIPNRLDTDSDGDGCSDALESGATTSTTANYQFPAPYGTNGLADAKETVTDNGIINYTSTYTKYAVANNLSICSDTDGDTIPDLVDIDDDNDGVLDAMESPTCYYTSTEAGVLTKVSTGLASTVNSLAVNTGIDIPTMHDGTSTTVTASNHVVAAGQTTSTSSVIYTLEYPTSVKLTSVSVVGATASWGTGSFAVLEGSADGITFTDALSAPLATSAGTTKTWTVTLNTANYYQYYRIRVSTVGSTTPTFTNYEVSAVLNTSGYVPSAHPKPTCATDTDNDGILNNLDLDSDGEGCPDAIEAEVAKTSGGPVMQNGVIKNGSGGAVTSQKTVTNAMVAGPYGANGFGNTVETGTESNTYNSTYTYSQAINGTPHANCATLLIILPVNWISAKASLRNEDGIISWRVAQKDVDYYIVQRSVNGNAFSDIGTVDALDNGASEIEYYFTDRQVMDLNIPRVLYRIISVDYDLRRMYSHCHVHIIAGQRKKYCSISKPKSRYNQFYITRKSKND
ncbi:MAG: discoidin domain-containing protein [Chitinophagaceae bacterium]